MKRLSLLLFLLTSLLYTAFAQDAQQTVQNALAVWEVLSSNVQLGAMTEKNEAGQTVAIGSVNAFGHQSSLGKPIYR